jgi:hypothetical protein
MKTIQQVTRRCSDCGTAYPDPAVFRFRGTTQVVLCRSCDRKEAMSRRRASHARARRDLARAEGLFHQTTTSTFTKEEVDQTLSEAKTIGSDFIAVLERLKQMGLDIKPLIDQIKGLE